VKLDCAEKNKLISEKQKIFYAEKIERYLVDKLVCAGRREVINKEEGLC
jgi:hypothetical protein